MCVLPEKNESFFQLGDLLLPLIVLACLLTQTPKLWHKIHPLYQK